MAEIDYYQNQEKHGEYQYVSLRDIVNNFMLMHTGNHSLINNEARYKVLFHAKRAIQELHYDAFRDVRVLEIDLTDDLRVILPHDYVNWVRVSVYKDGFLRPMYENDKAMSAKSYLQGSSGEILFDDDGFILEPENSKIDEDRVSGAFEAAMSHYGEGVRRITFGGRFGMNPGEVDGNPSFSVDKRLGVINFSSQASGLLCVLEYISDGLEAGDDSKVSVNKLFENYVYAYIKYEILSSKLNIQEYVVTRARKEKTALLRNARIRISNVTPGKILKSLRGINKLIK